MSFWRWGGRGGATFRGRRALVTGAASGLGKATALELAARGAQVALTDVNAAGLDQTAAAIREAGGVVLGAAVVDVRDRDAVAAMADEFHAAGGPMELVFNVAGKVTWGPVELLAHEDWKEMVDINLMGPINVMECFVGPMVRGGGGGHLVNVSSAAGLLGLPWHAPYSASKFGLRGVTEVLRYDLRRHRIHVSLVCPGAIATPQVNTMRIVGIDRTSPLGLAQDRRFEEHAVSTEHAVAKMLRGVERRKRLIYTSLDIRGAYLLQRFFPPGYDLLMLILGRQLAAFARKSPDPAGAAVDPRVARRGHA